MGKDDLFSLVDGGAVRKLERQTDLEHCKSIDHWHVLWEQGGSLGEWQALTL